MCHPAHGTKGYKSLFRVATHLVTAAFLSKAFCGNPFAMTSRFVCYGIRPRDFHHRLRKWKDRFLYRFTPPTGSLGQSADVASITAKFCRYYTLIVSQNQAPYTQPGTLYFFFVVAFTVLLFFPYTFFLSIVVYGFTRT